MAVVGPDTSALANRRSRARNGATFADLLTRDEVVVCNFAGLFETVPCFINPCVDVAVVDKFIKFIIGAYVGGGTRSMSNLTYSASRWRDSRYMLEMLPVQYLAPGVERTDCQCILIVSMEAVLVVTSPKYSRRSPLQVICVWSGLEIFLGQ